MIEQEHVEPTARETLALGYLSATLANRAGAWEGQAPAWFPEPPEWVAMWQEALDRTADVLVDDLR